MQKKEYPMFTTMNLKHLEKIQANQSKRSKRELEIKNGPHDSKKYEVLRTSIDQ